MTETCLPFACSHNASDYASCAVIERWSEFHELPATSAADSAYLSAALASHSTQSEADVIIVSFVRFDNGRESLRFGWNAFNANIFSMIWIKSATNNFVIINTEMLMRFLGGKSMSAHMLEPLTNY